MSSKPLFLRRATHVAACLALSVPALSLAVEPGFNPNTTSVVIPDTSTTTDIWKFVGTYNYDNSPTDQVSGVQVSNWWVLATKHAKPDPLLNLTYTNGYGSSTLVWCAPDMASGEDIALCLISPPINPPAGVSFPKLLADGRSVFSTTKDNVATGYLLGTGFGLPTRGTQSAAWVTPNARATTYHPLGNAGAVTPIKGAGDSGSGLFWFAAGSSEGVLAAINNTAADYLIGGTYFSADVQAWINSYAPLNWTTVAQYAPARRARTPLEVRPLSTTATSATIQITKPNLQTGETLTGYFVSAAIPPSTTLVHLNSITNQNTYVPYTVSGLTTNATYKFCAFSYNAQGLQNFSGEGVMREECTSFTPTTAPGAPTGLQVTALPPPAPGVVAYRASWTAPAAVSGATVTGYALNSSPSFPTLPMPATQTSYDFTQAAGHAPFILSVNAVNQLTSGPVSNVVVVP